MNEEHVMNLVNDHEGTEEWQCPVCKRAFLIEWMPWKKVVVVEGDATAFHQIGKGGQRLSGLEVTYDG